MGKLIAISVLIAANMVVGQQSVPAPKQIRFPLIQVGIQAKTGTPIMGCASGQVLMRLEVDYVHKTGDTDAQGTIKMWVEKTETWRISEDQTLLGDLHKRKHHECILGGHSPTESK